QYFTNDQIKEMTRKVSAEVDLVHQQTQNQRYGSSHIGATAKDISNVVTDASLIMFQTFISRHNSNFFSDKLVLTSVTTASSAPVLQTPKATSSTLYFDSLTVNAGNGGFLHCIQMDTSVNAANQVVSVGADIAFDA